MTVSYNLVSQPWIPVVDMAGIRRTYGLKEVIQQAHQLRGVDAELPPMTASILLLLLALLQRVYAPQDEEEWLALWQRGSFDAAILDAYLSRWESRFDLFDEIHPFYQDVKIGTRKNDVEKLKGKELQSKVLNNLFLHKAGGDGATLFDHSLDAEPPMISADEVARILLLDRNFGLGGMGGASISADKFYKDAPHARGMLFWMHGVTLFESLLLNLVSKDFLPSFLVNKMDVPAWELDDPWRQERNVPIGYLDFLTWPSRRVKFIPVQTPDGISVQETFYAPGFGLSEEFRNPFYHFISLERNGEQKKKLLKFKEGRSLWRDSSSIIEPAGEDQPLSFSWVNTVLKNYMDLEYIHFQTFGLCTEPGKKKAYFYGGAEFQFPAIISEKEELLNVLKIGLLEAENTSKKLYFSLKQLAEILLARQADLEGGKPADSKDIDKLLNHWNAEGVYWGQLETAFTLFMDQIVTSPAAARKNWQETLQKAAWQSLSFAVQNSGEDAGGLKAAALAERKLYYGLREVFEKEEKGETV